MFTLAIMQPIRTLPPLFLSLLLVSCFQTGRTTSEKPQRTEAAVSERTAGECQSVSDIFMGHIFDNDPVIPTRKMDGQNLEICNETQVGTCCTRSVEEKLLHLAVSETQDVVANFSSDLKSRLASEARLYRDNFYELLSLSENNTRNVLTSTFKIPVLNANASVEKLFSDFAAYIELHDQINVRQSVNQFFDAIFPSVFTFTLDNPNAVSDEYRECLANNRKDLRPPPFGEVARKLVQDVAKSLEVTRTLLEGFDLMSEAINITNLLGKEHYCSQAITRLLFCSRCEGLSEVQPCRNLCLNVMRGCMAHVTEVNNHWNLFVAAVEKLVVSLRGTQDVLNSFHSKVYESVMHYLDNAHRFHLTVINECGPPLAEATMELPSSTEAADVVRPITTEPNRPLLEEFPTKIQKKFSFTVILRNIASSKGFFNKLPDMVCDFERFSAAHNSTCWNGTSVSKYSRHVPVVALTTQVAENPELQVPDALVPDVVKLIERLNQMTKILHKRVIPRPYTMLSDSYSEYGSGFNDDFSGTWHSGAFPEDDDDYSGSGSGNDSYGGTSEVEEEVTRADTTDFVFDPRSTASSFKPSAYKTDAPATTAMSSTTVTTTTTSVTIRIKPSPPVGSHSSITSAITFLPVLAITIQQIYCA